MVPWIALRWCMRSLKRFSLLIATSLLQKLVVLTYHDRAMRLFGGYTVRAQWTVAAMVGLLVDLSRAELRLSIPGLCLDRALFRTGWRTEAAFPRYLVE